MIKVEVNEKSKENELPFPKLMINKNKKDVIILATEKRSDNIIGDVVGGNRYDIGHWSEFWDGERFVDFHGSITLTQE